MEAVLELSRRPVKIDTYVYGQVVLFQQSLVSRDVKPIAPGGRIAGLRTGASTKEIARFACRDTDTRNNDLQRAPAAYSNDAAV